MSIAIIYSDNILALHANLYNNDLRYFYYQDLNLFNRMLSAKNIELYYLTTNLYKRQDLNK